MMQSVITGTGSYIPERVVGNDSFLTSEFFEKNGTRLYQSNRVIIDKFSAITGIQERRYAMPDHNASDLAYFAATNAITNSGIDKESLDHIIVAHNFGDVSIESNRTNQVPSLGSRVKSLLQIQNPDCVAYDLAFGCAGWIEGMIHANYFIRSGDAKKCLVVGTETLSRVIDIHDRDSMIFSDGAAAAVIEGADSPNGIIAHRTETHAVDNISMLNMARSCSPHGSNRDDLFIKMQGRKVYEFALAHVPLLIKKVLDKAGVSVDEVSKVLVHQANEKMDVAILARLFQLYGKTSVPDGIMPMTIDRLGNSSVATVPTLLDLLVRNELKGHSVSAGDIVVMASVGAGMNTNAIVYRV
jgi:3-oxoacyl-[acyl-carrier-protein] synthase-3